MTTKMQATPMDAQDYPRPHGVLRAEAQRAEDEPRNVMTILRGEKTREADWLVIGPFKGPLLPWQQAMVDEMREEAKRQELPTKDVTVDGWYSFSVKVN